MLKQELSQQSNAKDTVFQNSKRLLSLAKKAHEDYLLKQQQIDLENAIDYYIRVLKLTPHFSEPYYKLAILLYNKKQITLEQALKQCKKAVMLAPDSSKAKLYYGYFLSLSGRTQDAKKEFEKAISLNFFTSSKARLALALTILKEFKYGNASFKNFNKFLYYTISGSVLTLFDLPTMKMLYKFVLTHITAFYFYLKGFLLKRIHSYDSAVKNYKVAATKTAKSENFYLKAGDVSYKNKNLSQAIESYKKVLEIDSNNSMALFKLTTIFQKHFDDKHEELIECYNRLLENNKDNPRLYYDLGNLYLKTNDRFSALNAFKMALELDNDNPFFLNSYAYVLIQLKHYDDALMYYKKAIKQNPDNKWTAVVCQAQGAIYYQIKGNLEAAITSYETAILLDSDSYDAYYSLGEIYQDEGDYESAMENYCKSLKLKETAKGYKALGILLWEEENIEESIIALEKCLSLDENDADAHNNLGMALLDGNNDIDRATKCFKNAIKLNPNDATAYYNLGRVYQIMQIDSMAAENYQMAINLNRLTNVMDEEEIQNRLQKLFDAD